MSGRKFISIRLYPLALGHSLATGPPLTFEAEPGCGAVSA